MSSCDCVITQCLRVFVPSVQRVNWCVVNVKRNCSQVAAPASRSARIKPLLTPDPSASAHKAPLRPPSQRHQSALGSSIARAPRGRSKARQQRSWRLKEGETPPVPKDHTLCTNHPPSVVPAIWTQSRIKHIPNAWPTSLSKAASRKSKLYKSSSNQNPLNSGSLYHHQPFFFMWTAQQWKRFIESAPCCF